MKASELTSEERMLYAPRYVRAAWAAFALALPFIGSFNGLA